MVNKKKNVRFVVPGVTPFSEPCKAKKKNVIRDVDVRVMQKEKRERKKKRMKIPRVQTNVCLPFFS
jgi:hypothetical protein